MPSPWHDGIVQILQDEPGLALRILREWAGVDAPAGLRVRLEPPVFNLLRCRVDVLVICPDQVTAAWYARPVATAMPGWVLQVAVVGPAQVPAVTDAQAVAASPALAALSVVMHGREPRVAEAFVAGVTSLGPDQNYYERAHSMAAEDIRRILEEIMSTTDWVVSSPFAREHFGRGKAEGLAEGEAKGLAEGEAKGLAEGELKGEAEAIRLVLEARGLEVTADQQARITGCTDRARLKVWVTRAATVQNTDELFA